MGCALGGKTCALFFFFQQADCGLIGGGSGRGATDPMARVLSDGSCGGDSSGGKTPARLIGRLRAG